MYGELIQTYVPDSGEQALLFDALQINPGVKALGEWRLSGLTRGRQHSAKGSWRLRASDDEYHRRAFSKLANCSCPAVVRFAEKS